MLVYAYVFSNMKFGALTINHPAVAWLLDGNYYVSKHDTANIVVFEYVIV